MDKKLGDPDFTKLFGFPGLEATIKSLLRHINILRVKTGLAEISYEDFKTEIFSDKTQIESK